MQINEDDPLGISGGINMDDPLGIKGPIQKMKPTSHDYWGDIGAAIEPLRPHGLLSQPQRLMNLIRQGFGAKPYGDPNTDALLPNVFESHPTPQELATNPDYAWMKGQSPQYISAMSEKLAQAELDQRTLGMLPGLGFFGGPQVPPWMLQPNLGRVVSSPQNIPQQSNPMFQGLQNDLAMVGAVGQPVNELVRQALSAESLAALPAFMATGPLALSGRALMAGEAASQVPQSVAQRFQEAGSDPTIPNITKAVVGSGLDAAVPYAMARFGEPQAPRQNNHPSEIRHGSPDMPFLMPNKPGIQMLDRPQSEHTLPIGPAMPWDRNVKQYQLPNIGQREVRIEQPIIRPGEINPQDPLQIEKGIGFAGEPKQGGQIGFQGQGIPSAMQSRVIPKGEQSEQAALMKGQFIPSTEKGRLQSGLDPNDIIPAINLGGKLLIGRQGDTHADILERNGIDPQAISHPDPARGFVNKKTGQFLSRLEAQKQSGIVGTAKAGGLDSMDLPGAAKTKVMRDSGFSDSEIRENLRFGSGLTPPDIIRRDGDEFDKSFSIAIKLPFFKNVEYSRDAIIDSIRGASRDEVVEGGTPEQVKAFDTLDNLLKNYEDKHPVEAYREERELDEDTSLYSGLNFNRILPGGKDDPMFPILTRIQDAGYETLYSEHGMGEGDSTPYVVFKRTSADKDARIKEAAKVVGAEVEERPKRIGVYLKESDKVEDIKKDWESFTKHLGEGTKLHSGLEPIEDIFTPTTRLLLRDPKRFRYESSKSGEFDGGQLVNRLMNQVPPIEKDLLEKAGIKQRFKPGSKVKAEEVDQWVKENSPKTEVKEYGMEREASAAKREHDKLLHEIDSMPQAQYNAIVDYASGKVGRNVLLPFADEKTLAMVDRFKELRQIVKNEPQDTSPQATPHYKFISPFDTDKYPVKRVDVVLPQKAMLPKPAKFGYEPKGWNHIEGKMVEPPLWPSDPLHEQFPNTLGWAMMQYKDGVAFIGEVQSRWGQELRKQQEALKDTGRAPTMEVKGGTPNHFLLRDYNRLILKAAIDQVIKDGMKRIILSDAETAMMTEGHDLGQAAADSHSQLKQDPVQAPGMRLNYDKILPQIMEELTGKKGEKVGMGEHKNAFIGSKLEQMEPGYSYPDSWKPRENLIFRNPDSTPKTSVTGLSYDISEVGKPPYSMFGKKLYSGLPIFDEKLWGSKDKVEKEQEKSVKLGLGKQPITSLPLDPDPESVNKTTTKLNSGLIPALTGYGVDRPLNEVIEAFAAKQAGWSAPRHIAANEELGNALVRVAASDIASVMESKASSPAVAASYKQNTFKLLYDAYINSRFGQPVVKGAPTPTMGGKPMELVHINKKPLWIRSDLEPEFSQALQTDSRVRKAGAALLMDLATELQVIGLTDFVFHGANMFGSIAYDLGAKTTEGDLVRGTVPGARHIDAMMRIGHEMRRVILDDPAVRRELADIAKIGALRAEEQGQSLVSRTPVVGKYMDMGRWIQLFDKAGRLARNKMFDNLVDRKLIKDTELDRREFINKMGQYNARLMSKFQDFQRQYVSQFVVAGRTFNRNAFQRVFMSNQARALNPGAYAKMKALNAASLFSALLVTPVVFNMWATGKPFGRKGTDIGSVDTGKDDENGRPIQIDILQTTLLRRGFRNVGLQALQKDVRAGKDFGTTATDMGRDVANGLIHPWAGPPIRAGWTAITGKSVGFGGFPLSKDTDSLTDNFLAGLSQVNPMVAAAYDRSVKGDKADGYFERTVAAVGFKKGPFPTHEDDLEKETGKRVGEMSLGERVQAEKSHKEKAEKLSPETKAKAAERSIANITKRGEELSKEMTKANRQWMESRGLNVPGFDNKIHAGKTLVYLTKDEMERLSKYTLEAYNEAMPEVRQKYPQLGDNSKDVYFNARMSAARGKARSRLIQELNSQNESNQKTKKRFTVFDNE